LEKVLIKDNKMEEQNLEGRLEGIAASGESDSYQRRKELVICGYSLKEIAEAEGIAYSTLWAYLKRKPELRSLLKSCKKGLHNYTDEVLAQDAATLPYTGMGKKYGLPTYLIEKELKRRGIKKKRVHLKSQELRNASDEELKEAMELFSSKEMGEYYGISYSTFHKEAKMRNLGPKKYAPTPQILENRKAQLGLLTRLLAEKETLQQIGNEMGFSRQWVSYLIAKYDLKGTWKKSIEDRKMLKSRYKQLVYNHVCHLLEQKLETASQAEKWAIQYMERINWNKNTNIERILRFFQYYSEVKSQGKKISVWEFARNVRIGGSHVNEIVDRIGLPTPGYRRYDKGPRKGSNRRNARVINAYQNTVFSRNDIAYFEGTTAANVRRIAKNSRRSWLPATNPSLALTSQIYEADDLGFSREEIVQLLEIKPKKVDIALQLRQKLESLIINELRILKQDHSINKPYL